MKHSLRILTVLLAGIMAQHSLAAAVDAYVGTHDREYVRLKAEWKSKYFLEDTAGSVVRYEENSNIRNLGSHWYLEESSTAGEYFIRNRLTGSAMHVAGQTGNVQLGTLQAGNAAYRWVFEPGTHFFRVRNVAYPGQYISTENELDNSVTYAALQPDWESQRIILEELPRGAILPWTSYDEDNFDSLIDPAHIVSTTYDGNFDQGSYAAEAQKNACVILNGYGTAITWTAMETANALTIRYSLQDGANGTITLSIQSQEGGSPRVIKVPVTSQQAWVYFDFGTEHDTNAPGRIPGKRYAEARVLLDAPILAGDTFSLSRENGDEMVWIDVVELESTAPSVPANMADYYDATQSPWNARGDGSADDYFAILNCLNAAKSAGKKVYLPAGRYNVGYELILPEGTHLEGAGMWHTELIFTSSGSQTAGGVRADGNNQVLRDLYIKGSQTTRSGGYKGIKGNWGTGSLIENVWVEETETGMWIADFYGTLGVTDGLVVRNCRFRNTFADGINMSSGTRNTVVENCHFRAAGDDALASWAAGRTNNLGPTTNQQFRYNTIECGYRAGGIGIFGGGAHKIHHNVVRDQYVGAGIRLNTIFMWVNGQLRGYPFNSTGEPIRIYDNTLIRTGSRSLFYEELAAVDLVTRDDDVENITFENIVIDQSQFSGIRFEAANTQANPLPQFRNMDFANVQISAVPIGTKADRGALGSADYRDVTVTPPGVYSQPNGTFVLNTASSIEDWQQAHFGTTTGPQADLNADPNLNGIPNLLEYAIGTNPLSTDPVADKLPQVALANVSGQAVLQLTITRRAGDGNGTATGALAIDGITYLPEHAPDLDNWQSGETIFEQYGSRITNPDGTETVTIRPLSPEGFFRLNVSAN